MVRHALKILQQMLEDFQSMTDPFKALCIKGLTANKEEMLFCCSCHLRQIIFHSSDVSSLHIHEGKSKYY